MCTQRVHGLAHQLVADADIHEAALWRLADWEPQEIEQITPALTALVGRDAPLKSDQPDVAKLLSRLERSDRRDPWTALCALLSLWAEATGNANLFWRTGIVVLESFNQAKRRGQTRGDDALDRLLRDYLRLHPDTTASTLFRHCQSLSLLKVVIVDAGEDSITYQPRPDSHKDRTVRWHAFEQRVSRVRKKLSLEIERPGVYLQHVWMQPVAVSSVR